MAIDQESAARLKRKNYVVLGILILIMVFFFMITVVRLGATPVNPGYAGAAPAGDTPASPVE